MKCEKCGKEHDGGFGSGRFCSLACANSREIRRKIVECVACGASVDVPISFPKKFNVRCYDCKSRSKEKTKKIKFCPICGVESKYGRCCSVECSREYKLIWSSRKIESLNGAGFRPSTLKRYLIRTSGHKCCICGGSEWNGLPMPLVMDHINGRAHDNRLVNLRLVCGNCDMQLPTYKSKNKNSDRKNRAGYANW